jgi:hypothetical protein
MSFKLVVEQDGMHRCSERCYTCLGSTIGGHKIYRWQYKYHDEPKDTFTRSSLILPGQEGQERQVLTLIGLLLDTQLSATG